MWATNLAAIEISLTAKKFLLYIIFDPQISQLLNCVD